MSEKGEWPKRVSQSEVYMKSKMCCIYLSLPCRRSNKVRQVPLAIHFEIGYFGYREGKVWKLPTEYCSKDLKATYYTHQDKQMPTFSFNQSLFCFSFFFFLFLHFIIYTIIPPSSFILELLFQIRNILNYF